MDIKEFTKKFVVEKLNEICNDRSCSVCPFHCVSEKSDYTCKLIHLDEALVEHGEEEIWTI